MSVSAFTWLGVHTNRGRCHCVQVNIMVLARVVGITITTAKRRSLMMAVNSNPVEQAYEQARLVCHITHHVSPFIVEFKLFHFFNFHYFIVFSCLSFDSIFSFCVSFSIY